MLLRVRLAGATGPNSNMPRWQGSGLELFLPNAGSGRGMREAGGSWDAGLRTHPALRASVQLADGPRSWSMVISKGATAGLGCQRSTPDTTVSSSTADDQQCTHRSSRSRTQ
jgi:hypothetical protein